ncbi:SH3 domain-containing protein [Bacillus sp. FJAT-52991]|uniref:SH3 domain-containing protein n=1 Tax=Bacillus kandeliae TaxID=3129297 RepID=A0ABZ2NCC2_9BACI
MKCKWMKVVLSFVLVMSFFTFVASKQPEAAKSKVGTVDISSGYLNVRSSPSTKGKVIGKLKRSEKVNVYSEKSGWAEIRYKSQKGYVSLDYLRFYNSIPLATVKTVVQQARALQDQLTEKVYTKKQIYSILSQRFTTPFIDAFFAEHTRKSEKDRYGNQLYETGGTDTYGYFLEDVDWSSKYKPKYIYYTKAGKQYLEVSQFYEANELNDAFTHTIYATKNTSKDSWKVYKNSREYK